MAKVLAEMDADLIKALIDALEASSLSELEYSRDGTTLRLVKQAASTPAPSPAASQRAREPLPAPQPAIARSEASIVTAPLFGVVHLQRMPGTPPMVAVGQEVAAGQVLCLIEAMKVFTELRAEQDGTVAAILVQSGRDVEAGQALFRLE